MQDLLELIDTPVYPPTLAGRLIGMRPDRVTRWLRGYSYRYRLVSGKERTGRKAPVVSRSGAANSASASFLDLIDMLFVRQFLDHGLTLQKVRRALDEATSILGQHHVAQRSFFTDGREIYLQVDDEADHLLQMLANGQWVIAPVIKQAAKQIDFDADTGFAERWYPLGRQAGVVLDPRIAFGAPTIAHRGIKTANVYDLYVAENSRVDRVAGWMNLRDREVQRAVVFERKLRHAA